MKITKKSEYVIMGLLYIACQPKERFTNINEIINKNNISKGLLLKLFNRLVKEDILKSKSGLNGGFRLKKDPAKLSLFDLLRIFETSPYVNQCAYKPCHKAAECIMSQVWKTVQKDIDKVFAKIDFKTLADKAKKNPQALPLKI